LLYYSKIFNDVIIKIKSAYIRNNLETVELDNMMYQTGMILRSYYLLILCNLKQN